MMLVQSHQSNALFVEQATTLWIATRRLLESSRACQEPGWGDLREKNQRGLYAHRISNESRQTGHGLGHADGDDLLSANASGETARGSSKKGMPSRLRRKTVVCQRDDRCDSDVERRLQNVSSVVHLGAASGETARDVDARPGVAEAPVDIHDAVRGDANGTCSISTFHRSYKTRSSMGEPLSKFANNNHQGRSRNP